MIRQKHHAKVFTIQTSQSRQSSQWRPALLTSHPFQLLHQRLVQLLVARPSFLHLLHANRGNHHVAYGSETGFALLDLGVWCHSHLLKKFEVCFVTIQVVSLSTIAIIQDGYNLPSTIHLHLHQEPALAKH